MKIKLIMSILMNGFDFNNKNIFTFKKIFAIKLLKLLI